MFDQIPITNFVPRWDLHASTVSPPYPGWAETTHGRFLVVRLLTLEYTVDNSLMEQGCNEQLILFSGREYSAEFGVIET